MWMLLFFGLLGFIFKCVNFTSTPFSWEWFWDLFSRRGSGSR
jgi:hypothetical protein